MQHTTGENRVSKSHGLLAQNLFSALSALGFQSVAMTLRWLRSREFLHHFQASYAEPRVRKYQLEFNGLITAKRTQYFPWTVPYRPQYPQS